MKNIILVENENNLNFIDNDRDDTPIYSILINDLDRTRELGQAKISEWISQLNSKSWANSTLLYGVAKIIQTHFPSNEIDWRMTFFQVEKKDYLEKYSGLKNEFDSCNSSSKDNFMRRVEVGQQENVKEVNDVIYEIVNRNLKENGILG